MAKICTIDSRQLEGMLKRLEGPQRGTAMLKALRKGGEVLRRNTVASMKQKLGESATRTSQKRPKPMTAGVTVKTDKDFQEVKVSIMGDFRDKWFETGTKERRLLRTGAKDRERGYYKGDKRYLYRKKGKETFYKAGAYRGRIKAEHFFAEARENETPVINAINQSLSKELNKILQ